MSQLTTATGCDGFNASSSGDGMMVAFESSCDFTGGNPDGNIEIFERDGLGEIVQLTDSTGCINANPSVSSSGTAVAFESTCNLVGSNSDGNAEIFLVSGISTVQLTNSVDCINAAPSTNAAGTRVAFDSDCDLVGGNADASNEIFQATSAAQIVQLTSDTSNGLCGSFYASSNAAGDLVAFESDCDLSGDNSEEWGEIFQVSDAGVVSRRTYGSDDCASYLPSSDAAGLKIGFESDCDFLGQNSDQSLEVFTVDWDGTVHQITDDDGATLCESFDADLNDDGKIVGFSSWCDLTGGNADQSIEMYTAADSGTVQLTNGVGCQSFAPALDSKGGNIAFDGSCDPVGDNADGSNEIFSVHDCRCGAPVTRNVSGPAPTATDSLFVLQAAVGQRTCWLCDCDVNGNGAITASDALLVLQLTVGQQVDLICP